MPPPAPEPEPARKRGRKAAPAPAPAPEPEPEEEATPATQPAERRRARKTPEPAPAATEPRASPRAKRSRASAAEDETPVAAAAADNDADADDGRAGDEGSSADAAVVSAITQHAAPLDEGEADGGDAAAAVDARETEAKAEAPKASRAAPGSRLPPRAPAAPGWLTRGDGRAPDEAGGAAAGGAPGAGGGGGVAAGDGAGDDVGPPDGTAAETVERELIVRHDGAAAPRRGAAPKRRAGVVDFRRFRKNDILFGRDAGKIVKVMRPEAARDSERARQLAFEEAELRKEEEYGEELFVDNAPKKGRGGGRGR